MEQTFWSKVWSCIKSVVRGVFTFCLRYPAAIIITIFVVIIAGVVLIYGKEINIGGLLQKIWGTTPKDKVNPKTTVVPGRVDDTGKLIPPGVSDDKGYVQAPAAEDIKDPGILDSKDTVIIVDPYGDEVEIPLPTGVENKDVHEVVVIKPKVKEVENNDKKDEMSTEEVIKMME
jgi:hypothetical protein